MWKTDSRIVLSRRVQAVKVVSYHHARNDIVNMWLHDGNGWYSLMLINPEVNIGIWLIAS